ncbi:hypothetical protein EDC96DRAFT_495935 [Choanephora cucurbitarum]|nr:hypothetical protein EDC96DRAFT_495935 [Choanephora cucurbitarum]
MIQKELTKSLRTNGCMSIASQVQGLKLPYTLIKSMVHRQFDTEEYIHYPTLPDLITTKEYIENSKSNIQSLVLSLEEPYPVFKLQKSIAMPEDLFYLYLEQLVQENTTLGFLRGKRSRAIFEPKQYRQRQLALIKSIFDSNECITMDTIESLYAFSNPLDLIHDAYEQGSFLALHSCLIKQTVKQRARETIESMVDYCDVNDILPEGLTFKDVNKVVELVMDDTNNNKRQVDGGYVITTDYMDHLVNESSLYLRSLLARHQSKLSDSEIIKAFENLGCPHHIAEKILPFKRTEMMKHYAELLKTPYLETASDDPWIQQHKSLTRKKLSNLRQSIYFNYQAAQLLKDAKKSLEKYILKTQCIEFLFQLVIYLILDQSYNKAEVSQSSSLCISLEDIEKQRIVDAKEQKWVITYFIRENDHKYDKTSVVEIEALMKKKDLELFVTILVQHPLFHGEDLEKTKQQTNTLIYNQLHNQLKRLPLSTQTAPELLHLVSLLLFQKTYKIPLYVSGKFVPAILEQLKPLISQETQHLLTVTHLSIVNNKREEHMDDFRALNQFGMTL